MKKTFEEIFKEAYDKADEEYAKAAPNFYKDLMQDLRAIGRSDDHIFHEFITGAYASGYMEAKKDEYE